MPKPHRRTFLKFAAAAAGLTIAAPLEARARRVRAGVLEMDDGFGPLGPVADEVTSIPLLELPRGFRYRGLAWTGAAMEGGVRSPGAPDGMAAFAGPDGLVHLIRNHELSPATAFAPALAYDSQAGGGTTSLTLRPEDAAGCRCWPSRNGREGVARAT